MQIYDIICTTVVFSSNKYPYWFIVGSIINLRGYEQGRATHQKQGLQCFLQFNIALWDAPHFFIPVLRSCLDQLPLQAGDDGGKRK